MNILVLGYSKSGKSTAADFLVSRTTTSPAKSVSTSDCILDHYCVEHNLLPGDVLKNKDQHRMGLWTLGRKYQEVDPLYFVREALCRADNYVDGVTVVTGVRNPDEMQAIRAQDIFDLIIWIERPGVVAGPTDKLSAADADIIIQNSGTIEELHQKLIRLQRCMRRNAG